MRFIAHASSSAGNLYVVESIDTSGGRLAARRLLIEAGLPWGRLQEALRYQLADIDGCLVTHSHGDHAQSARKVCDASVDLWATAETLAACKLTDHHRAHAFELREGAGDEDADRFRHVDLPGGWRVLPFGVHHDVEGAVGFLIQAPDGDQLLFFTDSGYLPVTTAGCTHLALECSWSRELLDASPAHPEQKGRLERYHMPLERLIGTEAQRLAAGGAAHPKSVLGANDLARVREIHLLHVSADHGNPWAFAEAVRAATGLATYVAGRPRADHLEAPAEEIPSLEVPE